MDTTEVKKNVHTSRRRIYRIDVDWGRGFGVQALFTAHPEDVEFLQGKGVSYGEICGKHSDINLDIVPDTIVEVPARPAIVEWVEANLSGGNIRSSYQEFDSFTISGHNPFEYYWYEDED